MKDLTGQRFGRLAVIRIVERPNRSDKRKYWLCKCDCGNELIISASNLKSGNTRSCGCLQKEIASKTGFKNKANLKPLDIKKIMVGIKKTCVGGTNVSNLNDTIPSHNTSGVKGVYWNKSSEKWYASIEFKKKRYYLGSFNKKEDAIKVRKQAEEMFFEPFLKWYEEQKKHNKTI